MPTKRKSTNATATLGVNFARTVVESRNCIFDEVDQRNDIGNDAYIEFIVDEYATGCCIATQIKSGSSYVATSGDFVLRSDKAHFEYWATHVLPVAAIMYDPDRKRAAWYDITKYLRANPDKVEHGPYSIVIPATQEFSDATFNDFCKYFLTYREEFHRDSNFGLSLEKFSRYDEMATCIDGMRSLLSFHRQRAASWFFLIGCIESLFESPLFEYLALSISYIPGHGDIGWNDANTVEESVRRKGLEYIRTFFRRQHVVALLLCVDEDGFQRGSFGQSMQAIIRVVPERTHYLDSIAFDATLEADVKFYALLLLLDEVQELETYSHSKTIFLIDRYIRAFPADPNLGVLGEIRETIREFGYFAMY